MKRRLFCEISPCRHNSLIRRRLGNVDMRLQENKAVNLIHWMILHSDLTIVEHHHHDRYDLFPDYKRKIPFGTGTSIVYNYLDYRFENRTDRTYQLIVYTTPEYLCGELRSDSPQQNKYHILAENEFFSRENGIVYRNGEIYRLRVDGMTGEHIEKKLIRKNHAQVLYDTDGLTIRDADPDPDRRTGSS